MRLLRLHLALLITAALALVAVASASAQPGAQGKYGGVLTVGLSSGEPDSFDPTVSRTASAALIFRTFCESLYDLDSNLKIVPLLATALPAISDDRLTYTIPLRNDVVFNDGTPFNAQAVATTLQRHLTLPGSRYATDLSAIDTVTARDPLTVVIHLKRRYSPLPALLLGAGRIMSPTQLTKLGDKFATNPICVGPFTYDGRVAGDSVTVIKSPYYYNKGAVHLDKIVFKVLNDQPAAAAALRSGDIQALDSIDTTQLAGIRATPSVGVIQRSRIGWNALWINVGNSKGVGKLPYGGLATPLATSSKLRQAFEEAIDRDALNRVVFDGLVEPGCTLIAPKLKAWYDATNVACTPYDPTDARKLVAASGVSNPTVHLLAATVTEAQRIAQFVQAQEASVGITVVLDVADFTTVLARAAAGNFETMLLGSTSSVDPGLVLNNRLASAGLGNLSGFSNTRFDYVMANGFKATTLKARQTLYKVAQQIIHDERPMLFLYHVVTFAGVSTSVTGIEFVDPYLRVAFAQLK